MTCRLASAILVAAVAMQFAASAGSLAQGQGLNNAAIEEALALGRESEPSPYTLHMNLVGTGIAGAVYTPFVRIAMASHQAHLQGRDLAAADVPDWLTEPVVYIALRWYCLGTECALPSQPIAVTIGPFNDPHQAAPLWVSRDVAVLRRFGATPTSPDTVAVASFPVGAIRPNVMVMTCVWTKPDHCDGRGGVISERDVATWR
jgi:hypothetical protein